MNICCCYLLCQGDQTPLDFANYNTKGGKKAITEELKSFMIKYPSGEIELMSFVMICLLF